MSRPTSGEFSEKGCAEIAVSCGRAATPEGGVCVYDPPLSRSRREGGEYEEVLARKRRAGSATRKPCNGGRLAAHSTNLRSSCSSASRDIQLVDRLLFGRQRGRHLDTSLLHRRLTGRWSRRLHVYTEGSHWRRSAWLPVPVGQLGFRSRGYLVVDQPPTIATKRSSAPPTRPREVHWHRPDWHHHPAGWLHLEQHDALRQGRLGWCEGIRPLKESRNRGNYRFHRLHQRLDGWCRHGTRAVAKHRPGGRG